MVFWCRGVSRVEIKFERGLENVERERRTCVGLGRNGEREKAKYRVGVDRESEVERVMGV